MEKKTAIGKEFSSSTSAILYDAMSFYAELGRAAQIKGGKTMESMKS
jgi:hypothetical protein